MSCYKGKYAGKFLTCSMVVLFESSFYRSQVFLFNLIDLVFLLIWNLDLDFRLDFGPDLVCWIRKNTSLCYFLNFMVPLEYLDL